jgi:lysophospholipase L1-like esterase
MRNCLGVAMVGVLTAVAVRAGEPAGAPAFDLSDAAKAERAKLYTLPGRANLAGRGTPLKDGMSIAFFGDSITMQGGYIRSIQAALKAGEGTKDLKIQLHQHGLNGGRVPTLLEGKSPWGKLGGTMQELLDREKPTVACIWIGVNDVWHGAKGTTPEDFEAGLKKMVAMCKAAGAKVVLAPLAVLKENAGRLNPRCDHYAAITRAVAAETGATLVDLRKAFVACLRNNGTDVAPDGTRTFRGKLLTYDGVHANAAGNEVVADLMAQGIVDALR